MPGKEADELQTKLRPPPWYYHTARQAHRAIESICLDRGELHLKDELAPRYAELIYNGRR